MNFLHSYYENNSTSLVVMCVFSLMACIAILFDLITGVVSARHEGHKISSIKWGVTINKIVAQLLYMLFACVMLMFIYNDMWFRVLLLIPVILYILREYISIGENMARRYGKMPYLFSLMDKIFDLLESGFFRMIEKRLNNSVNSAEKETGKSESKVIRGIRERKEKEKEKNFSKEP